MGVIKKYNFPFFTLMLFLFLFGIACKNESPEPPVENTGRISFYFRHMVDTADVTKDIMIYTNEAGNHYLITEIQYFISDVILHKSDGNDVLIHEWKDIHYVDNDLPNTMKWDVYDEIPEGAYDSVSFNFGICEEKNKSLMYVNPPERDMFWPEVLGGGYHYMKLNGKWKDDGMVNNRPFEFHLGIGQIYKGDSVYIPDIIGFIHNDFRVNLPNSSFVISGGDDHIHVIEIIMHVENWFKEPYLYNFSEQPENTMQYQDAIHMGCMNGKHNVFSVGYNDDIVTDRL